MKHIWVVEVRGADKWSPTYSYFTKKKALAMAAAEAKLSPGLKWRVAKYVRES